MTHYDMSGSEDGQLRSPGAERSGDEEHDTDSLDIKPPQANIAHSRESTGSRRKEKSNKEKKHSKEKKHKERNSGRERERDRSGDIERGREHRRDVERHDMERYHHSRSGNVYEREESREMMANVDRRYQKHYERGAGNNYHHHHQQQQQQAYHHHGQMHMQRQQQRQDYYDRSYHGGSGEYHSGGGGTGGNRHHQYAKHSGHMDYDIEMHRDRRKYTYEHQQQKDTESMEQDLRSRLLSKRHHYVKGGAGSVNTDMEVEHYEMRRDNAADRHDHSYEEHERAERHHVHHEKARNSVIEVLDSPEVPVEGYQRRKHKRRNREKSVEPAVETKRKVPDDPELLARRAKILSAEREKEKRKESAREELEARREKRRKRTEVIDALSPTAVAASVTAGLHVNVKRKKKNDDEKLAKRKRNKAESDDEDDHVELDSQSDVEEVGEELDEDEDKESASDSAAESDHNYKKSKAKKSKDDIADDDEDSDGSDMQLPESPLSIGDLSKSPKKRNKKKKQKHTKRSAGDYEDEEEDADSDEHSLLSYSAHSSRSRSHSASRSSHASRRSRTRSRSRSHSYSATSRSRSHSRSYSHSSRSRSRSRSEERFMKSSQLKADAEAADAAKETTAEQAKKKQTEGGSESPICDDKGVPLPNYFPGVQGCRSVEEFQCLNRIEEGTYGVVYRAKDKRTSEIVALKRLKMEKEKEGFPITSLREINTLLKGQHPNIVTVREIVVGSNMDKIFIVMDYVEHDLKSLMETMKTRKQSFFPGEVKCLAQQLLRAVGHLHDNWILHRDLKTSNLLLSHKGVLKVGDFGLAREYGSPLKKYTSLVVTLWYRAPELLLCTPEYSTPIDIWSVGCIFAEFLQMLPLFPGKSEIDQLNRIYKELGTPNEKIWPNYKNLPAVKNLLSQNSQFAEYPVSNLRKHFSDKTTDVGVSLLQGLLTYDPKQRLNADAALKHAYFKELPLPIDPSMFPTWPAKSELGARRALASSPKPPSGGSQFKQLGRDDIITASTSGTANTANNKVSGIISGNKKTAANTGFVLNAGIEQRQLAMGPGFSLKF